MNKQVKCIIFGVSLVPVLGLFTFSTLWAEINSNSNSKLDLMSGGSPVHHLCHLDQVLQAPPVREITHRHFSPGSEAGRQKDKKTRPNLLLTRVPV